jgi:nicotinamide-nucleotide amidase
VIKEGIELYCTPGVPFEMKEMVNKQILTQLEGALPSLKKELISFGIGESLQTELLKSVKIEPPFSFASLPGPKGLRLRLSLLDDDLGKLENKWNEVLGALSNYKKCIVSFDGKGLLDVIFNKLRLEGVKIAVAESCTGGLLGGVLSEQPGSSDIFEGGVISYSNEVKERVLGVDSAIINGEGAVSEKVALAMVKGVGRILGCTAAISITGVAGPGGGSGDKPVGTVWVGVLMGGASHTRKFTLRGDRDRVRERAVWESLNFFREKFVRN